MKANRREYAQPIASHPVIRARFALRDGSVDVYVDLAAIADDHGNRALRSPRGVAQHSHGALECRVVARYPRKDGPGAISEGAPKPCD